MIGPWILAILAAIAPNGIDGSPVVADLVIVNAKIWTVDRANPQAAALAVRHGRFLAVGSREQIDKFVGAATKVLDVGGKRVLPGFFDSHVHWLSGGLSLSRIDLRDAANEAEFGRRLAEFDKKLPKGRWMIGGDWDHDRTFAGELPTAVIVDKYCPDRPVFLRRYDGHMALVNSAALKLAKIKAVTPDPPGGAIFRIAGGQEPSGILRDNAMGFVDRLVPSPASDEIVTAVKASLELAAKLGVTSVEDMSGEDSATQRQLFAYYQQLAREGRLTTRIHLRWPLASWKTLADLGVRTPFGNEFVTVSGLKGFMDGSLGSSTAKMFQPYRNEPTSTGLFVTPKDRMRELVKGADGAGLSVAVHAIGDEAIAALLDAFAAASPEGKADRRFRVEHAQHIAPADLARFGKLGVVASMQPYHVADDGRWAEKRIGETLCQTSYAYRSLLDAKAVLAFGSDWPVAPLDPIVGIDAAVNRRTLDGKNPSGWYPAQRITVEEAIEAYTMGSAYASFRDRELGSITAGKLADFVVLADDIFDPKTQDGIAKVRVAQTAVGGRVVYDAGKRP